MITEQDLHEYNKWLMEVWNPNQRYIQFGIDAPKAYLTYKTKIENLDTSFISCITFIGEVSKDEFYKIFEKIEIFKKMGYVFSKHERIDKDTIVKFDYELRLYTI
jgi:hypothetical protein